MAHVQGNCEQFRCPLQQSASGGTLSGAMRVELADAYAVQSQSDLRVFEGFAFPVEECHRLHYLQMACEKIAKAYQLKGRTSLREANLYSHIAFSKVVQNLLKSPQIKERYNSSDNKRQQRLRNMERYARSFAQKIEKLAPAVDARTTPANAEYPWIADGKVYAPCDYPFSQFNIQQREAVEFLKFVKTIVYDFQQIALNG